MDNLNLTSLAQAMATGAHLLYVVTENERYTEGIVAQAAARAKAGQALLRLELHRRFSPRRHARSRRRRTRSPRSISPWPSPARRSS